MGGLFLALDEGWLEVFVIVFVIIKAFEMFVALELYILGLWLAQLLVPIFLDVDLRAATRA